MDPDVVLPSQWIETLAIMPRFRNSQRWFLSGVIMPHKIHLLTKPAITLRHSLKSLKLTWKGPGKKEYLLQCTAFGHPYDTDVYKLKYYPHGRFYTASIEIHQCSDGNFDEMLKYIV